MPLLPLSAFIALQHAQLGVVPVVAQAGTALLPLITLAITSLVGLLLNPRALLGALRRRPWIPAVMVALALAIWGGLAWLTGAPGAPLVDARSQAGPAAGAGTRPDWARVALLVLAQEAAAKGNQARSEPPKSLSGPSADPAVVTGAPAVPGARSFRGDACRSGYLGGIAPRGLAPGWTYASPSDEFAMHLSSPMVVGGAVYGASCSLDPPHSFGRIFRLDAATGDPVWTCESRHPAGKLPFKGFISSPALSADGRYLVIGQGLHTDYDSELVCLDAATGAVHWLVPTPLHIESSPSIAGDLVVAGAGAVEQGRDHRPTGDVNGHGHPGLVLGVRISDGHEVFRATVHDPEGSPLLVDGICYVASGLNGSAVVALRTQSDEELGKAGLARELWRTATPFPATGAVTLADEVVLVGCGNGDFIMTAEHPEGRVIALDKVTGQERWQAAMPDAVLGPIAVAGHVAIVPVRNGEVIAIDLAARGRVLWQARVHKDAPVLAGVAFTGALVYAVANDGHLAVFDAADGRLLEKAYLNGQGRPGELGLSTSSPLVLDGRLFVGSETGGLRCLIGTAP